MHLSRFTVVSCVTPWRFLPIKSRQIGLMIAFYSTNVLTHFETQRALVTKLIPYLESNFSSVRQLDPVTSEMRSLQGEIKELEEMALDVELKTVAESELKRSCERLSELIAIVAQRILPGRQFDSENARLEVFPGAGGGEASVFAQQVFDFYVNYSYHLGFKVSNINLEIPSGVNVGIQKASALVEGINVFQSLKYECGVHRVQRVPLAGTKNDRLQTSTCSVAVVPEMSSNNEIDVPESEITIEYVRSSGAGGQNVNTNDTAAKLLHLPTGIAIKVQEERSAILNRKIAVKKLKQELYRRKFESEMADISKSRRSQIGNMDRNEKIRTYNYTRNMISDHRLTFSKQITNINAFFTGELGFDVIEAMRKNLQEKEDLDRLSEILLKQV